MHTVLQQPLPAGMAGEGQLHQGEFDLLAPLNCRRSVGCSGALQSPQPWLGLDPQHWGPGTSTRLLAHRKHSMLEGHPRTWVCPAIWLQRILAVLCTAMAEPPLPVAWHQPGFWHEAFGTRAGRHHSGEWRGAGTPLGHLALLAARAWPSLLLSEPWGYRLCRIFVFCHHPWTLRSSNPASYKEKINVVLGVVVGFNGFKGLFQLKWFFDSVKHEKSPLSYMGKEGLEGGICIAPALVSKDYCY